MREEKVYTEGIAKGESRFLAWFDNFWYHYKWHTIVVLFFAVVFGVCTIQACTMEKADIVITYAGRVDLSIEENSDIGKDISALLSGEKTLKAELSAYNVLTDEQIRAMQGKKDANGNIIRVDTAFYASQHDTFINQLQSGVGSVLLLDPEQYKTFIKEDGTSVNLMPLSEALGEIPEGALDAYSIRFGDTEFYKNNPSVRAIPADTVLCLQKKIAGQKEYDREIEAFKLLAPIAKKDAE